VSGEDTCVDGKPIQVTHYSIHFGCDGRDVLASRWHNYALKFFNWQYICPVQMDRVDYTRPFQVRNVTYIIPVLGNFLATTVNIAYVRVDADYVISIDAHQ
jgi:hypothetical protein